MRTEDITPDMFNIQEAVMAQGLYCETNDLPLFAPAGGCCWRCDQNIYYPLRYGPDNEFASGISIKRAGSEHITGCPHCNYNFVG